MGGTRGGAKSKVGSCHQQIAAVKVNHGTLHYAHVVASNKNCSVCGANHSVHCNLFAHLAKSKNVCNMEVSDVHDDDGWVTCMMMMGRLSHLFQG